MSTHVKISHLVTTCYHAVNKVCSHCLFPAVDKSVQNKMLSTCNKVDDDCRLATRLFQQVDIVWTTGRKKLLTA